MVCMYTPSMIPALLVAALLQSPAEARTLRAPPPVPTVPAVEAVSPAAALATPSFPAGHWRGPFGPAAENAFFDATYTTNDGGVVLSASRMLQAGAVTHFEFERFAIVDNALTLTPFPDGKETVSFTYVPSENGPTRAVFANPQHDYPTRLEYALVEPDHLTIRLSAPAATDPGTLVFDLRRAP